MRENDRRRLEKRENEEDETMEKTWSCSQLRNDEKLPEAGQAELNETDWPKNHINFSFTITKPRLFIDENGEH